jgi:hypothetical protein
VVRIDIINEDDDSGPGNTLERRGELVLLCRAVKPDRGSASADLRVDRATLFIELDTTSFEAESLHQEVVPSGDVMVNEERDQTGDVRHRGLHRR